MPMRFQKIREVIMRLHWSLPVLGFLSLYGCALGPGQSLRIDDGWQSGKEAETTVNLIDISPRIIAQLDVQRERTTSIPQWLTDYAQDTYVLGPGDVLQITVWDHPELTIPAGTQFSAEANGRLVRQDGTIYYPYVGAVAAGGLTTDAVRAELSRRLVRYIDQPQVDVSVLRYGSKRVFLSGAFVHNEPLPLSITPLSLAEAIGRAGINLTEADLSSLQLKRGKDVATLNLDDLTRRGVDLQTIVLKDGDSLFMPYADRKKVYLMGEITTPRAIAFKNDSISLAEAIGSSNGLRQDSSKATEVYVIRAPVGTVGTAVPTKADVYRLNGNSPLAWVLSNRFALQPGDIVYIGAAGVTRFNRLVSQAFATATILQSAAYVRTTN